MPGGYDTDTVTRLETNLDDLSPELLGAVMEKLLAVGALEAGDRVGVVAAGHKRQSATSSPSTARRTFGRDARWRVPMP